MAPLSSSPEEIEAFIATLDQIAPGVYSLDGIIPMLTPDDITLNVNAADTTNTDRLWAGGGLGLGLTGAGVDVGVWDAGRIRSTHQEFNNGNRVTLIDTANNSFNDHATHVAGTIGARGALANARGMADQLAIRSRDSVNDAAELLADAGILDLSNHSYGFLRGWTQRVGWQWLPPNTDTWVADRNAFIQDPNFGKYTGAQTAVDAALLLNLTTPQVLDDTLYENPRLLSVWSAGNDRGENFINTLGNTDANFNNWYVAYWGPTGRFELIDGNVLPPPGADGGIDGGFDILPQSQVAKNSLAVGAINDITVDPYTPGNVAMSTFSSWGMTDDGRIKPDVVANGVSLLSSVAFALDQFGQPTIPSDTT